MDPWNYANNPRRPNFSANFPQTPQNPSQNPQNPLQNPQNPFQYSPNFPQFPPNPYQNPHADPLFYQDPGFQQFLYQQYKSQQPSFANYRSSENFSQDNEESPEKETGGDDDVEEIDAFQATQMSQPPKKSWDMADDEALISSYMNNSCDPRVGTNQRKENLWKKVAASYNNAQLSNPHRISKRNAEMLKGRWRRITVAVTKWVAAYDEATARKRSGMNEEDVVREAHIIYTSTNKSRFPFHDHWRMLERYPKWDAIVRGTPTPPQQRSGDTNSSGKRVRLDDDEGEDRFTPNQIPTPISDEAEFGSSNRPEGVKKAKNKGKKKMSSDAEKEKMLKDHMDTFNLTIADRSKLEREKEDMKMKKLERQLEGQERAKKWDLFNAFIARGEDNLTDREKKYFDKIAKDLGFD